MCYKTYILVAFDCSFQTVCRHGDSRLCCWMLKVLALLSQEKRTLHGEIFRPFRIHSLPNETYIILYLFYIS